MNNQLIAGYTAYTTADEYCAAPEAEAPATTPFFAISIAGFAASAATSYYANC